MSVVSSGSSSESYSSDDSDYDDEPRKVSLTDLISWNSQEGNLSNFSETFKQFSIDEKLFLLRSRCLSKHCNCNFKTHDLLLARVFVGLKVLVGKWCKLRFSKGAVPDTEKLATLIFFKDFQGWYEIMNENLDVIPFWNNVSQIIQNKPKLFILRKDTKCLFVKDNSEDVKIPISFDNTTLKAGTILSFEQYGKYSVKKGRRVKEQYLVKCKDTKDNCFYLIPDDTVYASSIAGFDNISGAHTFQSIIEKFHFPINVKPIFMTPPLPNLPCTDRHFLQLSERYQLDLLIVTHITDGSRLFLLTPALFDDHVFTVGEFLPPSVTGHALPLDVTQHISNYRLKIADFYAKCHRHDNLSYLLKPAENISKITQKHAYVESEFDEIYNELDGIYFFIRNGFFPRNNSGIAEKSKNDASMSSTVVPVEPLIKSSDGVILSDDEDDDDDDDDSTEMSSTSTDSDKTSSTAIEMFKRQRNTQAKSVPLYRAEKSMKNCQFNTTTSRCHINLTVDDMVNLSMGGVCVAEEENGDDDRRPRKITEVPRFYQSQAAHKPKEEDAETASLRDTVV